MTALTRCHALLPGALLFRVWVLHAWLRKALLLALLSPGVAAENHQPAQGFSWSEPQQVATGKAYVGPWRMNESEFHYVTDATVALRESGAIYFTWVDNERQDVLLQRYSADDEPHFTEPVNVSRSPDTFSWLPSIAARGDNVYILWQEIIFSGGSHGGEILFARSSDGGKRFSEPLNLSKTQAGAGKGRLTEEQWDNGSLELLLGNGQDVYAAWTEYEGGLFFRRSNDGGKTFEPTLQVGGSSTQPARAPALAKGPDGSIYLAWTLGEDDKANIRFARSDDGGKSFTEPQPVTPNDHHADIPDLAVDSQGRVHLVYAASPGGVFTASHVNYLALDKHGEALQEPRALSTQAKAHQQAQAPQLAADAAGNLYVIWEHHGLGDGYSRGLGFTYSSDGGASFAPPSVVRGSIDPRGGINGSLQGDLGDKLAVGADGQLIVANSHIDLGNRSRVLYVRGALGAND